MAEVRLDFLDGDNTDVFLVEISKYIELEKDGVCNRTANTENISRVLSKRKHKPTLEQLGWDLLGLVCPHLLPTSTHTWHLIHQVAMVGRPKEMVLALLEQMERVSGEKPLVTFMMLGSLSAVLEKLAESLKTTSLVLSTLNSTFRLLKFLYSAIQLIEERRNGRRKTRKAIQRDNMEEEKEQLAGDLSGEECGSNQDDDDNDDVGGRGKGVAGACPCELCDAVELTLEFVQPWVEEVRVWHVETGGGAWKWTDRQTACIDMLLSLLGCPLAEMQLSLEGEGLEGEEEDEEEEVGPGSENIRKLAEDIMDSLRLCHCSLMGCMEWVEPPSCAVVASRLHREADGSFEDPLPVPPLLGLGCYGYLLLAEGKGCMAVPAVYSHSFFFQSSLKFCKLLLEGEKNVVIKKGLKLFQALLSRLPDHTLQKFMLEDRLYMKIAKVLVNLMTLSQSKAIRQVAVKCFRGLLSKFDGGGRHKLYHHLLRTISHSGVKGLLVHSIKEEVASALKEEERSEGVHKFLGPSLFQVLATVLVIDEDLELMKELDWVMSSLNLLRYLLLRDKRDINETGTWDHLEVISRCFLLPLRQVLASTQAHCRNESRVKEEELRTSTGNYGHGTDDLCEPGKRDSPKMDVQLVGGEILPEPTLKEQIEMLAVSGHHLDMMESILVRVEELVS